MLKIKICGLRDMVNVSEVVKSAPDFTGFIFWPGSSRYIGVDPQSDLFSQVPPQIIKTGVFVNEEITNVNEAINRYCLNAVQFHGSESAEYCRRFKGTGILTIKTFGIDEGFDFKRLIPYAASCDYFLFDTKTPGFGGSGRKFNKNILGGYDLGKFFFLSGGIGYEDIDEIRNLRHSNNSFFGIDINSRFETSPGIKNAGLIKSFVGEIRNI
ncbi:MAG: phosphoribosylanthranilate isomerase [Bacteroidales bacterium]|jgi:phosphoribosylanthranilate isomerase|nr:phosphoribosylanthranilate isomerase [Bacteroidales bacterium]